MLTIKKVPTVVSNYQEDTSHHDKVQGCDPNCSCNNRFLHGSRSDLPLYAFKRDESCPSRNGETKRADEQPETCFLHNLLLGKWEDRMSRGLFRYDVTACETRILPGRYGFVAQLNEGRYLRKRPTEFRVDQVLQPFDKDKFNFTKIGLEEVLFRFQPSQDNLSHFFPVAPVTDDTSSPNFVAINVSPIEYGHVLLVPRISDCLPQRIDHQSLLLALHMAKEAADLFFRIGYNSLGAFATINHLHFQAYYLAVTLPVEKAPTRRIITTEDGGVTIFQLLQYPVRCFGFEGWNRMKDLSDAVASSCVHLQENNIPFNLLIANSGKRIFLFPQCYAEKQAREEVGKKLLDTRVNPAAWEISGHIVLKRRKDYEEASEASAWRLLAEVSLPDHRFRAVKSAILQAIMCSPTTKIADATSTQQHYSCVRIPSGNIPHVQEGCTVNH